MAHDVFLSYSSKDQAAAAAVCGALERKGVRVWMAPRDVLAGKDYDQQILDAIDEARVMALVLSRNSDASKHVKREVERADKRNLSLVPLQIEDFEPRGLSYFLGATHRHSAYPPPLEAHLERLTNAVTRLLRPDFAPPPLQVERAGALPHSEEEQEPPVPPKSKGGLWAALAIAATVIAGGGWYAYAPAPPVTVALQEEFETAMQAESVDALDSFVAKHLSGPFTKAATQRRDKLKAEQAARVSGGVADPTVAPRTKDSRTPEAGSTVAAPTPTQVASGPCGGVTPASLASRAPTPLSAQEECALRAGSEFRECENCGPMVVVPAGSFTMGSPAKEKERWDDEGPQHDVRFANAFAVGKFAVTFDEWDACVAGGGCNAYKPEDQGWGRGRRPVINVSWTDANAYVAWLSKNTAKAYRLLSEAEWEYAARGRTKTPFWQGATISTAQANYDGNFTYGGGKKGEFRGRTVPVDSFAANPFGLYNVHGNAWQWVEDCYHEKYDGAPKDGSSWTTGDCGRRVLRGGSWVNNPWYLRAAYRYGNDPDDRNSNTGFRLARALTH